MLQDLNTVENQDAYEKCLRTADDLLFLTTNKVIACKKNMIKTVKSYIFKQNEIVSCDF